MSHLRQLVISGHSVIVIEHNPDVIRCSDWNTGYSAPTVRRGAARFCSLVPSTTKAMPLCCSKKRRTLLRVRRFRGVFLVVVYHTAEITFSFKLDQTAYSNVINGLIRRALASNSSLFSFCSWTQHVVPAPLPNQLFAFGGEQFLVVVLYVP